ncbi:MAG: mechanosensitive ion channel domain-containing protein [Lentilitoribacter sp.]
MFDLTLIKTHFCKMMKCIAFSILASLFFVVSGFSQQAEELNRDEVQIEQFDTQINSLENRFEQNKDVENVLIDVRTDASALLIEVQESLDQFNLSATDDKAKLTALGDAPSDGSEAQAITIERKALTESTALLTVYSGRLEKIATRLEDLIFDVGITRRDLFTSALFERVEIGGISIFEIHSSFREEMSKFWVKTRAWLTFVWEFKRSALFSSLAFSGVAGLLIYFGGYRIFGRFILGRNEVEGEGIGARLTSAFWSAAIPTLTAAAVGLSTYLLLLDFGVLRIDFAALFARLIQSAVALVLVLTLAIVILSPWDAASRLVNLTNRGAKWLFALVGLLFAIRTIAFVGVGVREILDLPLQSSVAQAFFETIAVAAVLIIVSRLEPIAPEGKLDSETGVSAQGWIRITTLLAGVLLILISLVGYVALAAFIATQIVVTGALLIVIYFGLLSAKSVMVEGAFAASPLGMKLSKAVQLSEQSANRLGLLFGILIYLVILGLGISFILLQWGFASEEVMSGVLALFTHLQIGGINISLLNIGIGLILFGVGFFATRRFQQWLDRNVLVRGKVELGVRNSIRKVIGYFGIALAAMIAISAAGFDLSNLALVAGALSLGIGFGLQTIVSNFVSGLILLAERPFKAGDWVETTSVQGIVKEISVRATEIETFSRKSVIVPNSELVNAAVGNWTHRNPIGRIQVMIGVSYDNSPQRIIDLLVEIANENPNILSTPEPSVEFADFGASSLDFVIRAFLSDIGNGLSVRNELRVAIYERFKAENIEIPFPHREVFVHNVDDRSE